MSGDRGLREALAEWFAKPHEPGPVDHALADALLPVVEAECRRRAAEELRALGRHALCTTPGVAPVRISVSDLYARADAIEGPRLSQTPPR